jgi:hypothetical protein
MKKRVNVTIEERLHDFVAKREMNFSKWINEQVEILSSSVASKASKEDAKDEAEV